MIEFSSSSHMRKDFQDLSRNLEGKVLVSATDLGAPNAYSSTGVLQPWVEDFKLYASLRSAPHTFLKIHEAGLANMESKFDEVRQAIIAYHKSKFESHFADCLLMMESRFVSVEPEVSCTAEMEADACKELVACIGRARPSAPGRENLLDAFDLAAPVTEAYAQVVTTRCALLDQLQGVAPLVVRGWAEKKIGKRKVSERES